MIADSICCKTLLVQLVKEYLKDLKVWFLGQADWTFLAQPYTALHPFYDFTKLTLDGGVTIGTIQSVYIKLSTNFKRISNHEGEFYSYNIRIVDAFRSTKV
jgi:hypothetical protein